MRIVIAGGSGFIGRYMNRYFTKKGHDVLIISRRKLNNRVITWEELEQEPSPLESSDVIINLAGASVAGSIWSESYKQKILYSRVSSTKKLIQHVNKLKNQPQKFIQASATGYYGSGRSEELDETNNAGTGFLAEVSLKWEAEAKKLDKDQTRLYIVRFGIVLGDTGGMFPLLKRSVQFFTGATLGDGSSRTSWVHINDLVRAIECIIISGTKDIYNITAPNPTTNKALTKSIGKALFRPVLFRIPKSLISFVIGKEMTNEFFFASVNVIPKNLLEEGFEFNFKTIDFAVRDLV